jgi:hypothetical protein
MPVNYVTEAVECYFFHIELRESEEIHTVPLDWLLEVIQFAKEKFFK